MLIDGSWVDAASGATYRVPNPATEEPVGSAPDATVDDMRRAIAAARRAFDEGPWPRSSRHDRARVLTAIADDMERRKEELRQMLIAEAVAEADLPPGVVNFVTGESNAIAETLVSDPRIDKVSFTGSVATGKKILAAAAATLKRVHLELGGKSVAIFLDTDDLDVIAPQPATPTFFHAGQGCAMPTRVLVPRVAHDPLVQNMVDFVRGMVKVGDPADPSTFLGPVIRDERRQKIEEYIESGKRDGAVLAHGGGRPKELPRGYFLEPTIFCGVQNHIRIAQEEIFGPVVAVLPFRDPDEAIRIANDSTYGLGGMIFSRDTARAIELGKRIRTGAVWINNGINLLDTPFGGFKESGVGREGGRFGMEEYTELQQISWRA